MITYHRLVAPKWMCPQATQTGPQRTPTHVQRGPHPTRMGAQLLLRSIVCFNSYPQLFKLFNQRFQHHIYLWTRSFQTRYGETKEHELKLHTKMVVCCMAQQRWASKSMM
jgi:hypothetical protein